MKYYFVSDIHGEYDKLISALQKNDFNDVADTLVVLGDAFDRGTKSLEVLKFILSCQNHIIVLGNHDLRLKELILNKDIPNSIDERNGVLNTFISFCGDESIDTINIGLSRLAYDVNLEPIKKLILQYLDEGVFALEWKDLIATHNWVPVISTRSVEFNEIGDCINKFNFHADPDWRNANKEEWYKATSTHTGAKFSTRAFPEKKMVIGHWHAWRLRRMIERGSEPFSESEEINFNTFEFEDKLVAIDGCSNAIQGKVNVFIYESDEEPNFIIGKTCTQ